MSLKKLLLFTLLLFIGGDICLAKELEELDGVYEIRYKWYKEEIEGDYYIEGQAPKGYQYYDKDNYIYTDYLTDFKLLDSSVNLEDTTRDYELYTKYYYKKPLTINYINLGNFTDFLYIKKINIYYQDALLDYSISNSYGTDWDGTSGSFDNYSFISFGLDRRYNPQDITIEIITEQSKNIINYEVRYAIGCNDTYDVDVIKYVGNNQISKYKPNNDWNITRYENTIYEGDKEILESELYLIENIKTYYRYRNKLLYYYNINKKYYGNNYYAYVEGYLPDYNDYQIYYISDNRQEVIDNDKVINVILENKNNDIKEVISNSTSSLTNTSTITKEYYPSNNKYLVIASTIISLAIVGIGLINISCKKCRTN